MLEAYADRWALITGASSGIGAEFAERLAARGMHLVLTARSEEKLNKLAQELHTKHGTRCEVIVCDLTMPEQLDHLMDEINNRQIDIELLVNSAGFAVVGEFEKTDSQQVLKMVQLNISALTDLTYRLLPDMLERQHGAIINVSSVAAFQPVAYMGAYAASKSYVLHFSESLWTEVRDRGVTVMALCPGVTRTSFFDVAGVPGWLKKQRSQSPEQVVKAALHALEKRKQYTVSGWRNYFLSLAVRLASRKLTVSETMKYFRPTTKKKKKSKKDKELKEEETNQTESSNE